MGIGAGLPVCLAHDIECAAVYRYLFAAEKKGCSLPSVNGSCCQTWSTSLTFEAPPDCLCLSPSMQLSSRLRRPASTAVYQAGVHVRT